MSAVSRVIEARMAHVGTPSLKNRLSELSAVLDVARGMTSGVFWQKPARHKDRAAIVLPGFGSSPAVMAPVTRLLARNGYAVDDWGQGFNNGEVERLFEGFKAELAARFSKTGTPHLLVGWSLGGYIAREAARDLPDMVSHVITMGSPVVGGPKYTVLRDYYSLRGQDNQAIADTISDRYNTPLSVPVTAIYSKSDGIVSWEACIDHWSPNVRHEEIAASHLGMAFSPDVLAVIDRVSRVDMLAPDKV